MNKHTPVDILRQTLQRIEGAYAPATIRAFKADFNAFTAYCQEHQLASLPTHPSTVSNYIDHLSNGKFTSAYIRRILVSISTIHKLNRLEDPTKDCDVQLAMRRMHRKLGRSSKQVAGINKDTLNKMLQSTDSTLRGIRDKALLLVAYDTLCRRSEIVELLAEDIKVNLAEDGLNGKFSIKLRKSKTDQNCQGRWLYLSGSASEALKEWVEIAGIISGPIFRGINRANHISEKLGAGQIARIYKRIAKQANLDCNAIKNISGHSMRVGAAQDLMREGVSLPNIMNRGRWSKTDTVMRYVEQMHPSQT
ncbi:tyrosine-type recombinase/integrase [Polynucleobacter sp. MWH-UH2A]|uniref:tyrosine-type recombinase/integrase n=1 Tax=Polynucleobacter sp. MWH-UH2A TaxID=1855617 RepID=UPI001BFEBA6C|nr:tyrosine-type recombinase/integrase [Polynucleobacter sp. MWH-UH2A]QWD64388.1 tyrosine-type recombinase/integrase [Polynucleobacter sp. MWH-UH2A]